MSLSQKNRRNTDQKHGKTPQLFRVWLSSHDLISKRTGKKQENGFLDVRGDFAPDPKGRIRRKLRVSLCCGGKRSVFDSSKFLSLTGSRCDCSEMEEQRLLHVEMRAWHRRMVLDAIFEKPRESGAHWSGRGEWRLYRGKRLIDAMICENVICDCEFSEMPKSVSVTRKPIADFESLSDALEGELAEVDWSRREVLVGSLGSKEQFRDNLRRNYYYVPAKYLDPSHLPILYVALYQSANLFGSDAGVCYYGEVSETRLLRRREIKFRSRWKRDDELYYAFRVKEWRQLPTRIEVKDEGVYAPRLTNLFLLRHATQSYELFHVHSAEQYRLLKAIRHIVKDSTSNDAGEQAHLSRIDGGVTLSLQNGVFDVLDRDGKPVLDAPIRVSDFSQHPKYYFGIIIEKMKMKTTL